MTHLTLFALSIGALAIRSAPNRSTPPALAADSLGSFPRVSGRNLEGRQLDLPADFAGKLNVVLVAFKREQQTDVDSWMPFLKTITSTWPDVHIYELPTLGRRYSLMRSFIDGGMRRGIPDQAVREATITLYIEKSPFRAALKIADEERISVFLVDRDGRVLWRADGRFDAESAKALTNCIAT